MQKKRPAPHRQKGGAPCRAYIFTSPTVFPNADTAIFYSLGGSAAVPQEYVDALLRELARLRWQLPGAPDTLYFGGGTPSLLRPAQAARLIDAVRPAAGAEITLEANPETLTPALLRGFLAAGVNRLSLGVQTAFDESLRRMGRPHTAAQSRKALLWAREAGFANISGDVMLALPGYTEKELTATLDLLQDGGCTHISCYLLKLEPGTPWGEAPPERLPDDDRAAGFYLACTDALAARDAQYEISNFAKPGFASRHNLLYWNCQHYLGLGPHAHSCLGGRRFLPAGHGTVSGRACGLPARTAPAHGRLYHAAAAAFGGPFPSRAEAGLGPGLLSEADGIP